MQLFYATDIKAGRITLDPEESRHCLQVLRKRVGDSITVVDGLGAFYEAAIVEAQKNTCICQVQRDWRDTPPPVRLHIGIAPTKNINRLEWFLEKATEIGVQKITPLLCRHSERKTIRPDRLEKILLSAMKQSQRAYLPELAPLTGLEQLLDRESAGDAQKFIAYIDENVNASLRENYVPGRDVCILIGPEGGFAPAEVERAVRAGFTPVSLGAYRLRTETAGMVAGMTIQLLNDNA